MALKDSLLGIGMAPHAATAVVSAASRPRGMIVFCGPAGVGKTTVAQLVVAAQPRPVIRWLGDLRMPEEIGAALAQSETGSVVAVVRSGESTRLRHRWSDMKLPAELVERASVVIVTLRRLARRGEALPDLLVLEVLSPNGTAITGLLVDEARSLVESGLTTDEEARFHVPDYV